MKKVGKYCKSCKQSVGGRLRCQVDSRRRVCSPNKACFNRDDFEPNKVYMRRLRVAEPKAAEQYEREKRGQEAAPEPVEVGALAEEPQKEKPTVSRVEPDPEPEPVSPEGGDPADSAAPTVSKVSLSQDRCHALTKKKTQCENDALPGKNYCHVKSHKKQMLKRNKG